ncbi:MAG: biotin transporter BioY [Deltaproteobacteria bacterium]|nr:biotin transporter BioY [Deltaproteobacteria bacterium]
MVYASMFGSLTAIGAYIMIPLPPVPITFQTLFLNLAGALLGGYLGALSQVVYILLGVIGLPVFAGGKAGLGVLLGPTGGYLFGFVLAAFVVGKLIAVKKDPGLIWTILSMMAGMVVIYFLGILQLTLVARLSVEKAIVVGALPFLPGDMVKIVLASLIYLKIKDKIHIR